MSNVGFATLSVIPSLKGIDRSMTSGLAGPLTRAGKDAGDKTAHAFGGSFKGGLRGVAGIAAGVLGGAVVIGAARALGRGLHDMVTEAKESVRVGKLTGAVLKSTGGAAGISAAQVGGLATKLSNLSGVDDEVIQSAANVLLTFTQVRNEVGKGNDIFNQASTAALNMSAALGQDLQSSTIQLGKALNDPIKGITALSRVGVSFTAQQKDQIKTLVASGNVLGAQKVILKELGTEFGGAAAAAADPLARLSVIAGNFKEQLGGALLPVIGQVANSLGALLPALGAALTPLISTLAPAVVGVFSALLPAILPLVTTLAKTVAPILTQLAGSFADTFEAIGPILSALGPPIASIAAAFGQILQALIPLGPPLGFLVASIAPLVSAFAGLAATVAQAVLPLLSPLIQVLTSLTTAFVGTADAPGPLIAILSVLGDVFREVGAALLPVIVQLGRQLAPVFGQIGKALVSLAPSFSGLGDAVIQIVKALAPLLPLVAKLIVSLAASLAPILPPIVAAVGQVASALAGALGSALSSIVPAIGTLVRALLPILPVIARLAADLVTGLVPVLPELAKAFADLVVAVTPLLPQLLQLAVVLLDKIGIPTIVALATALAGLATAMTPLLTNTKVLTPLVFGLAGSFAAFKGVQAVQAGILGVAKAGGTAVGTFQRLSTNAKGFFGATKSGAGSVAKVAKGLLDFGKNALLAAANIARQTLAFVAQKAAMVLAAAAQKALTAAQWLLNIAMEANPIGLVVVAIAALAAGIVLAYQHFKPFRDIVDAVGRALRTAFDWVKDHWPLLLTILTGPFGLAVAAIRAHWSKITGFASAAFNWIKRNWPLLLAILTGPIGLAVLTIVRNWDKIKNGFRAVKDFIGNAVGAIVGFITGMPGRIAGTVSTLWNGLRNGIRAAKDWIGNRINDVVGFVTGLPARISTAASGMWDGIKDAFKSAINFIIRGWNSLEFSLPSVKVFGKKIGGFTLGTPDIPELATGAVIKVPTLAWLGETQRARPEIVSPIALMRSTMDEALKSARPVGGNTYIVHIDTVNGPEHLRAIMRKEAVKGMQEHTEKNGFVPRVRVSG